MNWYTCSKCNHLTNATPESALYAGACDSGGLHKWKLDPNKTEIKQENEELKARILRLEERIAELMKEREL